MDNSYPNWLDFAYKNQGRENESFENLARTLFKMELGIEWGLFQRVNQKGNETAVVKKEGRVIGFQAKYFDHTINTNSIIQSMQKAKEENPNQTHYYIYCNKAFGNPNRRKDSERTDAISKKTQKEENIESAAKKLNLIIVWRLDKDILDAVSKNEWLKNMFFNKTMPKLEDKQSGLLSKPIKFNNIRFLPNLFFTGREEYMHTIESLLDSGSTRTQRLFISGMGGVGKSEMARQYVINHRDVYDCIWWIDAQEEQQVVQAFMDLAHRRGLSKTCDNVSVDDTIAIVKHWLQEENSGSWLIVFDNVISGEMLKRFFPIEHGGLQRHIIVTTQDERLHRLKDIGGEGMKLGVFSIKEAILFLERRTKLQDPSGPSKLAKELGCLPLALEHAAAYICSYQINYEQYLALYHESSEKLLQTDGFDEDGHTVFNTIEISVNGLKRRYGEATYQLLCIYAYMSADNNYIGWLKDNENTLFPFPLKDVVKSEFGINNIVKTIANLSLLRYAPKEGVVSIHRLIQKVIAFKEINRQREWIRLCKQLLIQQAFRHFPSVSDSQLNFNRLSAHIVAVLDNDTECNKDSVELKKYLSSGFLSNEQNDRAMTYCNQAIENTVQLWGENNTQIGELQLLQGKIQIQQGLFDEAIEVLHTALIQKTDQFKLGYIQDILNALLEKYDDYQKIFYFYKKSIINKNRNIIQEQLLQLAAIQNFLGTALREKGEYDEAIDHYQKACAIREERLGKEHLETAKSYNNIGLTYLYKKEYDKSEPFLTTSINIIGNKLGLREHEYLAQVYNNLGEIFRRRIKLKEALECQQLAKDIRVKIFGYNHSETANSYNNIGSVYLDEGETWKALVLFKRAADIYERVKGNTHSYTGIAYLNIAKAFDKRGNIEEAICSANKALGIFNKSLIPTHEYIEKVKNLITSLEKRKKKQTYFS